MLDHVFLSAVTAATQGCRAALLEHHRHDDRLTTDLLLGEVVWETSFHLPGEEDPPTARADLTLDWPTWSQSAWRSLTLGEEADEPPELGIEIVVRLQRLAGRPELSTVLAALPDEGPAVGPEHLHIAGAVVEESFDDSLDGQGAAVEISFEGTYRVPLNPEAMDAPRLGPAGPAAMAELERDLAGIGSWMASTLVRLGDLGLAHLPPDPA